MAGDGTELRSNLLSKGLEISSNRKARELLTEYIQRSRPEKTARCVEKVGWHGSVFVLPDRAIGQTNEMILFQTAAKATPGFGVNGTLDDWQREVSVLCQKNSRLLFAASMSFAAILLQLIGEESGGIHLVGSSSTGKSTALRVATSIWGEPGRLKNWKATANGLEGVALLHNDTILSLDELGQVDPREAGEIAYMLANGTGKARAARDGSSRRSATWRVLFLSSGEIGLVEHMRSAGKRARAGQEVRLVEIPADAGAGLGLFEELHDRSNGAKLASVIRKATEQFYGTAVRAYLEKLTTKLDEVPRDVECFRQKFLGEILSPNADGQVRRVAGRIALIAAAGELATAMGITGWKPNDSLWAAQKCFSAWISSRGGVGSQEEKDSLAQVRLFLERHGEARFTPWNGHLDNRVTSNRAGFRKEEDGRIEYFVLPGVFRTEVCEGLDSRFVIKVLREKGVLEVGGEERIDSRHRVPGFGNMRLYHLIPSRLEEAV